MDREFPVHILCCLILGADEINLELKVLQLNINSGYNEEVKRKCLTLFQYMQYVEVVRKYLEDHVLEEVFC